MNFDFLSGPTEEEIQGYVDDAFVAAFSVYTGWLQDEGLLKKAKKRDGRTLDDLASEFYFNHVKPAMDL